MRNNLVWHYVQTDIFTLIKNLTLHVTWDGAFLAVGAFFFVCFFFWNAIGGHQFHFDISHVHFYSFSPYPLFFSGRCAMRNRQLFIYFFNLSHISRSIFLLLLIFPFLFFMTHFPIST